MPKGPRGEKRPADVVGAAVMVAKIATGEIADRHFSGKFVVRVPPELHRRLAIEAAEAKVSLNRLASLKLAG